MLASLAHGKLNITTRTSNCMPLLGISFVANPRSAACRPQVRVGVAAAHRGGLLAVGHEGGEQKSGGGAESRRATAAWGVESRRKHGSWLGQRRWF